MNRRLHHQSVALRAAAVCCLALLPGVAFAQKWQVHQYTERDGLPGSPVYDCVQDSHGVMWFATRVGLVRYDGFRWTTHTLGVEHRKRPHFLIRTKDGTLWAATRESKTRIFRMRDGEWSLYAVRTTPANFPRAVRAMTVVPFGDEHVPVFLERKKLLWHHRGAWRIEPLDLAGETPRSMQAIEGGFVIATPRRLVRFRFDGVRWSRSTLLTLEEKRLVEICPTLDGAAWWLFGDGWIGRFDGSRIEQVEQSPMRPSTVHWWMSTSTADRAGGVYFATERELFRYVPGCGVRSLTTTADVRLGPITRIYRDRDDLIWVCGAYGIAKIVGHAFANYDERNGLLADEPTAILRSRSGRMIVAHNEGLSIVTPPGNGHAFRPEHVAHFRVPGSLPRVSVMGLAEDPRGVVWIAAGSGGLLRWQPGQAITVVDLPRKLGSRIHDVIVTGVLQENGDDVLWVANGPMIHRISSAGVRILPILTTGRIRMIRSLTEHDGTVFAVTQDDIFRVAADAQKLERVGSVPDAQSFALLSRGDHALIGSDRGLFELRDGEITRPSNAVLAAIRRPVYFIEALANGVCLGTDNGLLVFDGATLRRRTVVHGFVGTETNRAAHATDRHGNVWAGAVNGLSVYRPALDRAPEASIPLRLTAIESGGKRLTLGADIRIPTFQNDFTIHFEAAAFRNEEHCEYRTRLVGTEAEFGAWRPLREPVLRFEGLDWGTYEVELQIRDPFGATSQVARSPKLTIRGPAWVRNVLIGLGVLIIAIVGASLALGFAQRRQRRDLERAVAERTRSLRVTQDQLAVEADRWLVTLDGIADAVVAIDSEGLITLINPAASALTTWPSEDAIGRDYRDVLVLEGTSNLFDSERSMSADDVRLVRPNGERLDIELTAARVGDADHRGIVIVFRDATARRRLEAERTRSQKLDSIGQLAGGIAHDFNNLLAIVVGNLSVIEADADLNDATRASLHDVIEASQRGRMLTRQLLTFSRGGAPSRAVHDVVALVRNAVSLVLRGTPVRGEVDAREPQLWANVDAGQIEQLLYNLLRNSVQAMPDGGTIHARIGRTTTPPALPAGDYLAVELRDTGPGIPLEHHGRIFDPYFTTRDEGTGLGLTTAYSIAARHGGLLTMDSTPEQGATFTVYLPIAAAPEDVPPELASTPGATGGHALVMDDLPQVRAMLGRMLDARGYQVTACESGDAALAAYRRELAAGRPFDLAFFDLTVPGGMGGRDAAEQVRELHPDACVVAMSGYAHDPVHDDHRANGFAAFLAKPFSFADLDAVLRAVRRHESAS